jgi:uncharacterized protein YidB (DUF937 family)
MIAQLTRPERNVAMGLATLLALLGLTMAALGNHDPMAVHGFMALALGLVLVFAVGGVLEEPLPNPARLLQYYDDPIKVGIVLAMIWGVFAMSIGLWVAALMVWPDATFGQAWSSYGRLRPLHTTGVIFAFGGNALIATSFHVMQRTCRARLADQLSPWFVLIGYNLFCLWAVSGYFMGITQSKEYAEPEWYADIWLVIIWVAYLVLYLRTLKRRAEPHIYVANWYYLAFIVVVTMLHIVNAAALPVSWTGAKSYPAFSGVQDAMVSGSGDGRNRNPPDSRTGPEGGLFDKLLDVTDNLTGGRLEGGLTEAGAGRLAPGGLMAGLSELLERFTNAGQETKAQSWVSSGRNESISTDELEQTLDDETIAELVEKTGLSRSELLARLSQALPDAVDQATTDGQFPPLAMKEPRSI